LQVIKTFGVDQHFEFEALAPYLKVCDFFLLDTKSDLHGGTGLKFNWEKIGQYHESLPFFLSGGIEPADAGIIKALRNPALYAVDINSRFETEPGIKNIQQVRSFIKEIKSTTT
jgi:phosphoribosylanthranilate isomerase